MVVAIHAQLFPSLLYPWLRMAVPLFFIMSSFFFWKKLNSNPDTEKSVLSKFIIRNSRLYLFWFLVLLPYTLYVRHWFDDGVVRGLLFFIRSLLFSSTFPASWFLQALMLGVLIVYFASKKMSDSVLLLLSVLIYFFVVLKSSYWNVVEGVYFLSSAFDIYTFFFDEPIFNFSAALVWIVIGKIFAEHSFINKTWSFILLVVSAVFLYLEWLFVKDLSGSLSNDCYFSLLPFCFFFFATVKDIKLSTSKLTIFMGKASILIYTTHKPVIEVISFILRRKIGIHVGVSVIAFVLTVILCLSGSFVVFRLEKFNHFKFLRYSH